MSKPEIKSEALTVTVYKCSTCGSKHFGEQSANGCCTCQCGVKMTLEERTASRNDFTSSGCPKCRNKARVKRLRDNLRYSEDALVKMKADHLHIIADREKNIAGLKAEIERLAPPKRKPTAAVPTVSPAEAERSGIKVSSP